MKSGVEWEEAHRSNERDKSDVEPGEKGMFGGRKSWRNWFSGGVDAVPPGT